MYIVITESEAFRDSAYRAKNQLLLSYLSTSFCDYIMSESAKNLVRDRKACRQPPLQSVTHQGNVAFHPPSVTTNDPNCPDNKERTTSPGPGEEGRGQDIREERGGVCKNNKAAGATYHVPSSVYSQTISKTHERASSIYRE